MPKCGMDGILTVSRAGAGGFNREVSSVAVVPAIKLSRNASV
jgi:hypothetical protein